MFLKTDLVLKETNFDCDINILFVIRVQYMNLRLFSQGLLW